MKKRNLFPAVLALACASLGTLAFAACGGKTDQNDRHEHTFSSAWESNETHHWHVATCEHADERSDYAVHDYAPSDVCVCGKTKPVAVTEVMLDQTSLELNVGETFVLQATVTPSDATDKTVTFSSDKPTVASADNDGKVTALTEGVAVVTATAGGKSASCTVTVSDQPSYTAGLSFEKTDDGYKVTGFESEESVAHVVIPAKYEKEPVTEIGKQAFWGTTFRTIEIPSSVKRIGDGAFQGSAVEEVVIPDSVESMGWAFFQAEKVKSVTVGDGIAEIAGSAFRETPALETVVLGSGVKTVGQYAFYKSNIKSIELPDGVTLVDKGAFQNCENLEAVAIGAGVQTIGDDAFAYTGKLKVTWAQNPAIETLGKRVFEHSLIGELVIPDSVTSVGLNALGNCYELYRLTIGANAVPADKVFSNSPRLVEVYNRSKVEFKAGETCDWNSVLTFSRIYNPLPHNVCTSESGKGTFSETDGYLFYSCKGDGGTENYLIGYTGKDTALVLPEPSKAGFTSYRINRFAFWEHKSFSGYYNETYNKITSVTIPNGVTEIGEAAFETRPELTTVTVGEDVAVLGAYAFTKCTKLKTVVWNAVECEGFTYKDVDSSKNSFQSCTAFDTLTFGNKVKTVPARMFYKCTALTSVTIPASVTKIDDSAFYRAGLTSATFEIQSGWKTATTTTSPTGVVETPNFSDATDILNKLKAGNIWTRS